MKFCSACGHYCPSRAEDGMDSEAEMRSGAKRIARESSARMLAVRGEERATHGRALGVVAALAALALLAAMLCLAGCRAVPPDVREAAITLAEDAPLLLDVSQPRDGLSESEIAARAALEAKVRRALVTLRARAED